MNIRGLVGPDEPRYAAIAREMAKSGDWVTPRLNAEPWFEKPALLYWLGAIAIKLGIHDDLATRLPVILISIVFLGFFLYQVKYQFGSPSAEYALLVLGTSIGWSAFSQIGTFDLPLTVSLTVALLILVPWAKKSDISTRRILPWFGTFLGISVLAKGLIGPAIAAATLLSVCLDRGFTSVIRDLAKPRVWLPFVAIVTPWYLQCYAENGAPFLEDFFWKHHFQRLTENSLGHVQPIWFFVPVLAIGFLPWTPLLFVRSTLSSRADTRIRFLLVWCISTFLLFSLSTNKLPGYILPMFPPMAILVSLQLNDPRPKLIAFTIAASSLILFPIAEAVLPRALSHGLTTAWPPDIISWSRLFGIGLASIAIIWAARLGKQRIAIQLLAATAIVNLSYLQVSTFPAIDRESGVRPLWKSIEPYQAETCIGAVRRHVVYGLDYYSNHQLPRCNQVRRPFRVTGDPPQLVGPDKKFSSAIDIH